MRRCITCGKESEFQKRLEPDVHKFRFALIRLEVPAEVCGNCGETYISGPVLLYASAQVGLALAKNAPPDGEAFRFMRKTLRLPARFVAMLLNLRPETISRWEKGGPMDLAAFMVMRAMVLDRERGSKDTITRLASLAAERGASAVAEQLARLDSNIVEFPAMPSAPEWTPAKKRHA